MRLVDGWNWLRIVCSWGFSRLSVLKFQLLLPQCRLHIFLFCTKQHITMINSNHNIGHAFEPVQFNLFLHILCFIFYLFSYRIFTVRFLDVVSSSKLFNYLATFNSYLCIITNRGNQHRNDLIFLTSWEFVSKTREFPLLRNPMNHYNQRQR